MGMGRPPLPENVKVLHGLGGGRDIAGRPIKQPPAFKHEAPEKPDSLSPLASELWDRLFPELTRLGLLKEEDGEALAVGCETYARWYNAVEMRKERGITTVGSAGSEIVAPWVRIEEAAGKQYIQFCHEFGLTPSAEMRLAKDATESGGNDNAGSAYTG